MLHFESHLPTEPNMSFLEYFASVPALLRHLFEFRGEKFCDVVVKYRATPSFQTVADNITHFHTTVEDFSKAEKSRWVHVFFPSLPHLTK
jgi:hypothetical protein